MKIATLLGTALAAAAASNTAFGAGTAQDPARFVLPRSDFPARTQWTSARTPSIEKALKQAGLAVRAVGYTAIIPQGGTEDLLVDGLLISHANTDDARRVFASYKNPFPAPARDIVRLPIKYGDEQLAIVTANPIRRTDFRGDLRVRKGTLVWRLQVRWSGTDGFTRARALAELKTYAGKQKRRIGAG